MKNKEKQICNKDTSKIFHFTFSHGKFNFVLELKREHNERILLTTHNVNIYDLVEA